MPRRGRHTGISMLAGTLALLVALAAAACSSPIPGADLSPDDIQAVTFSNTGEGTSRPASDDEVRRFLEYYSEAGSFTEDVGTTHPAAIVVTLESGDTLSVLGGSEGFQTVVIDGAEHTQRNIENADLGRMLKEIAAGSISPPLTAPPAASPDTAKQYSAMSMTYGSESLRVGDLLEQSDVVLSGVVIERLPAAWNGPDGARWQATGEEQVPLIYTTWTIEAERVLKGDIRPGDVVAFRYPGGVTADAELDTGITFPKLRPGDEVIVLGFKDDTRFGGTYNPAGYWMTAGAYSVFLPKSDGALYRAAGAPDSGDGDLTMKRLEDLVQNR